MKRQEYRSISAIDFDIKEARMAKGISRAEAAKYCGVSCNTFALWESQTTKKIFKENYDKLMELLA